MRKTGLIILMTAAALSMSACGRTKETEPTKPKHQAQRQLKKKP